MVVVFNGKFVRVIQRYEVSLRQSWSALTSVGNMLLVLNAETRPRRHQSRVRSPKFNAPTGAVVRTDWWNFLRDSLSNPAAFSVFGSDVFVVDEKQQFVD